MPAPRNYVRGYSFAGYQATNPNRPLPGPALDNELEEIEQSLTEAISGLNDIRRADGQLRNGIVGRDALAPDLSTGVRPATLWQAGIQYQAQDTVSYLTSFYRCTIGHLSTDFLADLTATRWELYAEIGTLATDAQIARNEAVAARNEAVPAGAAATAGSNNVTALYDLFDDRYLGEKTSLPTLDNDGNAIVDGALVSLTGQTPTTLNGMYVRRSGVWQPAVAGFQGILLGYRYVATGGQTVFTGADANGLSLAYTIGGLIVTVNGVTLSPNTYTATNGTSVVLGTALSASDVVVIYSFGSFAVADTWTKAEADGRFTAKTRFVFPEDYGAVGDGVADDAAAFNAAHTAGFTDIMLRAGANYGIGSTINVPASANYFAPGRAQFTKIANCDLFTLNSGGNQRFFNFRVNGNGATRTGRGFVVTGGNDQIWDNVSCADMEGFCLEVTVVDCMQRSLISGGTWSRTTPTLYAIKYFGTAPFTTPGTNADSSTTGARRVQNINGGGTHVLDLSGTTEVTVSGINTTGIQFTAGTRFVKLYGNRISGAVIVSGNGHSFSNNQLGAGLTLDAGVTDTTVELGQMSGLFTDSSGNQTNLIYGEATDFTPILTGSVTNPTLGAGSASGRFMRSGRTVSLNITIVFGAGMTGGSGNYEIALPAPYNTLKFKGEVVGTAWAFDAGTGYRVGACRASSGLIKFDMSSDGAGGLWGATAPITWASGDRFTISATGMLGE